MRPEDRQQLEQLVEVLEKLQDNQAHLVVVDTVHQGSVVINNLRSMFSQKNTECTVTAGKELRCVGGTSGRLQFHTTLEIRDNRARGVTYAGATNLSREFVDLSDYYIEGHMQSPATDEQLVIEFERQSKRQVVGAARIAYERCAQMLRLRKVL